MTTCRIVLAALLALTSGAQAQSSCQAPIQLSTATSILSVMKSLSTNVATLNILTGKHTTTIADLYATMVSQSPIKWTGLACATIGANGAISKTGCGNGWNGGAISTRGAFGDASVQFRCTKAQHTMLGLSIGNTHSSYTDIDCAIYCDQGTARIYERGAQKATIGAFDSNTVFAVKRAGTKVTYTKDSKLVGTCGYTLMGRMLADLSIHSTGKGGIVAASWVGSVEPIPTAPIQWTGLGCAAVGISGMITKSTSCANGWNGGAVSAQGAYGDVEMQFRCAKTQSSMIGLAAPSSTAFSSKSYQSIDCAMYCNQGTLRMFEKGVSKQNSAKYVEQDLLALKRVGSTVTYWRNGAQLRTCGNKLSGYILADVAIHNSGKGGLLEAFWVGVVAPQPRTRIDAPGGASWPIKWKSAVGATAGSQGRLYKTGAINTWDAGAVSTRYPTGDAEFAFRCTRTQYTMIGFAKGYGTATGQGNSHQGYGDIDCATNCAVGTLQAFENGVYKKSLGVTYTDDTWIWQKKVGATITWGVGSKVLWTCGIKISGAANVDTSIYFKDRGGIIESKWIK